MTLGWLRKEITPYIRRTETTRMDLASDTITSSPLLILPSFPNSYFRLCTFAHNRSRLSVDRELPIYCLLSPISLFYVSAFVLLFFVSIVWTQIMLPRQRLFVPPWAPLRSLLFISSFLFVGYLCPAPMHAQTAPSNFIPPLDYSRD